MSEKNLLELSNVADFVAKFIRRNDKYTDWRLKTNQQLIRSCMTYHCKSGDSLAHVASRQDQLAVLRWLKEEIPDYNFEQADLNGKRPIHEAAQCGNLNCLQYLIALNVEIDCLKKSDWSPLMLSCSKNNVEAVKALIDAGASTKLRNKDGWTSFHIACREGNVDIVSFLLRLDPHTWDSVSNNGRTPLHTAGAYHATQGTINNVFTFPDRIVFKLPNRLSRLIIDKSGRQALHHSAQTGSHLSVAFLLSEYPKIDVSVKDVYGVTPLQLALKVNQADTIQLLTKPAAIS